VVNGSALILVSYKYMADDRARRNLRVRANAVVARGDAFARRGSVELRKVVQRSRQALVLAALTGVLTGLVVAGFERVVVDGMVDRLLDLPWYVAAFGPLIGLILAAMVLRWPGGGASPATADEYLRAFHDPGSELRGRGVPARVAASIATLGLGGAMGMEGPSLYMGAAIGSALQRRFARLFDGADRRLLLVAGAAAGVAAIFKAPATGAVFALEVPYQDDFARRMLLPALVASASSYLVFAAINGTEPLFPIHGAPPFSFRDLAGALLVGFGAGLGARTFAALLRGAKRVAATWPAHWRVPLAGLALALLAAASQGVTGRPLTLGSGYEAIRWASNPTHAVLAALALLILRCLATAATVGGGGVGGLFVPLVVAGALLGRVVGGVVASFDTTLFLVLGVAAFLGAGYRVPLAGVVFVAEATGHAGFVVPGLLAAVVAELMMGSASVTSYQLRPSRDVEPDPPARIPPPDPIGR
jgi:CIC family chloride channel protein